MPILIYHNIKALKNLLREKYVRKCTCGCVFAHIYIFWVENFLFFAHR